jgi:endonuclease/exonuclease/phosphatase family metal-dependent hydrolase
MPTCSRILRAAAFTVATSAASLAAANAQTTLVLDAPVTQVSDTMIQAGSTANSNFDKQDFFATRASTNVEYLRRALLKFDTQNTLPADTRIQSATLTLTIKTAGTDAVRTISVFPVTTSFLEEEATWNKRRVSNAWAKAGGDLGLESMRQAVTNQRGAKVTFNVTALVQAAVAGANASRYTRLALADLGASTSASYREYFSSQAIDPAVRPMLTVVYGSTPASAPAPAPAPVPAPAPAPAPVPAPAPPAPAPVPPVEQPAPGVVATLRVLHYNTHHGGYGTDDVYNTDRIADAIAKTNPDIVSLQEVEVNTSWSKGKDQRVIYRDLLQQRTGATWYTVWFGRAGGSTGLGELILSKYPFVATSHVLLTASRSAVDAAITVNGRTINFTSVHLDNEAQSNRLTEINELLAWETTLAENRIIVGDYNAWPNTTEIANMTKTYIDTWAAAKAAGTAVSWAGNPDGITHGSHRIDYIFQSKGATALTLKSAQVFDTSDYSGTLCSASGNATCFKYPTGIDPSDHRPVMAVFEVR